MTNPSPDSTPNAVPVVVYDFRVMSWLIFGVYEKQANHIPPEERAQYLKSCWAVLANRGPNAVPYQDHLAVFVDDNGSTTPYWRKVLYPEYKAGRKQKPDQFLSVAQIGLDYICNPKSPFHYFTLPGYEADDFAGSLVYIKRLCQHLPTGHGDPIVDLIANRELWLYTVDSDWLQLVGQGVTWYNSGPWEPRVRGVSEACEWAKKRLKVTISHPESIVDVKMVQGDKSDNLPPGSPRYMIDLMNQHPEHHLRNHFDIWKQLWLTLADPMPNQRLDHYNAGRKWIIQRGYQLPV